MATPHKVVDQFTPILAQMATPGATTTLRPVPMAGTATGLRVAEISTNMGEGMKAFTQAGMWWRLCRDLKPFLGQPISPRAARATIQHRLERRDSSFLRLAERCIYGNPTSPYLALLKMAGCELPDLVRLVGAEGLEGTLECLSDEGVYVTFDELKGRRTATRGSQSFQFAEADFDNSVCRPHFTLESGGTRGPGTKVRMALDYISDFAINTSVALQVHGFEGSDQVIWILPTGWIFTLRHTKLGNPPVACFFPRPPSAGTRIGSSLLTRAIRWAGSSTFPMPRVLDLQGSEVMVSWLEERLRCASSVCVTSYASSAVRVSLAAQEMGTSLEGVCFVTLGEPLTEAKKRAIEASGATTTVHFGTTETGFIGYSCARPESPDDVHLFSDSHALVERRRQVGETSVVVDALALTSLLLSAPKILLNAETGDYGKVERRSCGCEFDTIGLDTHIEHIRSFEKLSSEGMTFARTELLGLLENILPSEFGGTTGDYQVVEKELAGGVQRVLLVISPRVGPIDEERVRQRFLEELAGVGLLGPDGAEVWRQAQTIEVDRSFPVATRAGKILPFHLLGG